MQEISGFAHFLEHTDAVARLVLCALVCGSIASWYVIVWRLVQHLQRSRHSRSFLKNFWSADDLQGVTQALQRSPRDEPFSQLVLQGLQAAQTWQKPGQPEAQPLAQPVDEHVTRALRRTIDTVQNQQEFGQTWLATVASSAPFVGLLGTVWGIYHALMAIGASGQSSLEQVAGPVGEALIMTGIGLAVAIPAAMAYNVFSRASRQSRLQLSSFAEEVHFWLVRGVLPSAQRVSHSTQRAEMAQ